MKELLFIFIHSKGIDGIQYLPVSILDMESNVDVTNYYVANVLNIVDALNLENSDYSVMDLDGKKIYFIRKYAVTQNKVNNHNLFKLQDDEIPLFVSESIQKMVTNENITGCDFLEIKVI
jgi:hypothetical protein